ncbi:hypothetical protein EP7_003583 [Isosphaeraceae bacterium EP7]
MDLRLHAMAYALLFTSVAFADGQGPKIRLETGGPSAVVIVEGLEPQAWKTLAGRAADPGWLSELLTVRLKDAEGPPMLGRCRVVGQTLRFEPRFPLQPGLIYRGSLHLEGRPAIHADFSLPRPPSGPPARVIRVTPTAEDLPENLLKFYVTFSAPMARGEAYTHVQILDRDDRPLSLPFLELGEELWDPTGTRLTLLLDPGRIKRGLVPREEEGPILISGRSYTLRIRKEWPDAGGNVLAEEFRKPFRATCADEVSPALSSWKLTPPRVGSLEPVSIDFPEPLDDALLRSALRVEVGEDQSIEGSIEVDRGETRWRFRPKQAWTKMGYRVVIEAILEDRSGNNLLHPFEVDVARPSTNLDETRTFRIPFRAL